MAFGFGESAQKTGSLKPDGYHPNTDGYPSDRAGAGSGWFGGYASHSATGGAGGGSSFILTQNAEIPMGEIISYDSLAFKSI